MAETVRAVWALFTAGVITAEERNAAVRAASEAAFRQAVGLV